MIQDPYAVLGVSESAGDDELKKAYREKSKKWQCFSISQLII